MTDFRVGFGYDSHRFVPGRQLVVGGVVVPYHLGLKAHSDGDVLLHAVCDSLLGAAGLKDIGTRFPDTDERWKDADSAALLADIVSDVEKEGWKVNNLDCTLVLEEPKIKPYVDPIAGRLSELLNIGRERISVKAKTNEKMGFTGRGEGVAAFCVVTIVK